MNLLHEEIPAELLWKGVWEPVVAVRKKLIFAGYSGKQIDEAIAITLPHCVIDVIMKWVKEENNGS